LLTILTHNYLQEIHEDSDLDDAEEVDDDGDDDRLLIDDDEVPEAAAVVPRADDNDDEDEEEEQVDGSTMQRNSVTLWGNFFHFGIIGVCLLFYGKNWRFFF
jgi:hypothetical protein